MLTFNSRSMKTEIEENHYSEKQIVVEVAIPKFSKTEHYVNGKATQLRKRPANDAEFATLFSIKFYPNGNEPENDGYVSTMFQPNPRMALRGIKYYSFNCTVSVVDMNEELRFGQSFGMNFNYDEEDDIKYSMGLERFIKREVLLASSEDFLPGDTLTLRCDVAYVFSSAQEGDMTEAFYQQNELKKMAEDESWFAHSKTEKDFTDHCPDSLLSARLREIYGIFEIPDFRFVHPKTEEGITGHWLILKNPDSPLCTRLREKSGYFKCLFRMASKKMAKGLMSIDENEYEAFFNLMGYIRCDTLKHVDSIGEYSDLYKLADKYEVLDLKEICSVFLEQRLTNRTATWILAIADFCYDAHLRKLALRHVLLNWKEVCRSPGWRAMRKNRPDITKEVNSLLQNLKDSNSSGNKPVEKYKNHAVDFDFYR